MENTVKKKKTILNVKYEKECRLGLGCAMVQPKASDGTLSPYTGRQCHLLYYSLKTMRRIDDYEKMVKIEIERVKFQKSTKVGYWLESGREDGKFYLDENVTVL